MSDRAFSGKAASEEDRPGAEGWDPVEWRYRNFSIIVDSSAPLSPPGVLVTQYRGGFRGGRAPGTAQFPLPRGARIRRLYHRFAIRVGEGFVGHPTSTNKLFHIWVGGENRVFYRAVGAGRGRLEFQVALQGVPDARTRFRANIGMPTVLTRGSWHVIEVLLQLNSAGSRNGTIEFWMDGRPGGRYADVEFLGPHEGNRVWTQVQWSPTWGGGGSVVAFPFQLGLDHAYLSGAP